MYIDYMRTISETLRSTLINWLHRITNIKTIGPEKTAILMRKLNDIDPSRIQTSLDNPPKNRLKSRKPIWAENIISPAENYNL